MPYIEIRRSDKDCRIWMITGIREDSRREGYRQGQEELLKKIQKKLSDGMSVEQIARELEKGEESVRAFIEQMRTGQQFEKGRPMSGRCAGTGLRLVLEEQKAARRRLFPQAESLADIASKGLERNRWRKLMYELLPAIRNLNGISDKMTKLILFTEVKFM